MDSRSWAECLAVIEPPKFSDDVAEAFSDLPQFHALDATGDFQMRVCTRFLKDSAVGDDKHNDNARKQEGPFCVCGRRLKYHFDIAHQTATATASVDKPWSYETDTQLVSTNANGRMFNLRYLRLDCDADFSVLRKALEKEFSILSSFDMLVTFIGDDVEPVRSRQRFHLQSLLSSIQSYNGLCVTDFAAFRAFRRVVTSELGFTNWLSVLGWSSIDVDTREELVLASGGDRLVAESPSVLDKEDRSNSDDLLDERDFLVDGSGFALLVDNGKLGVTYSSTYDLEYKFRSRLENEISGFASAIATDGYRSALKPCCYVLFGGDHRSLRQLRSAFVLRGVPFVVMKGSGRMADIVAVVLNRFALDSASTKTAEKLLNLTVLRNLIDFPIPDGDEVLESIRQDLLALVKSVSERRYSLNDIIFQSNRLEGSLFDNLLSSMLSRPRSINHGVASHFSVESYTLISTAFRRNDAPRVRLLIESLSPAVFVALVTRRDFLENVLFNMKRFDNCAFSKVYADTNEAIGPPPCHIPTPRITNRCCASSSSSSDLVSMEMTRHLNPKINIDPADRELPAAPDEICPLSRIESVLYDVIDFPVRCPLGIRYSRHDLYRRVEPITFCNAPLQYVLRKLECCAGISTCGCFTQIADDRFDTRFFYVFLYCVLTYRADLACVLLTLTGFKERIASLAFSCNLLRSLKEWDTRADSAKRIDETIAKFERVIERQLTDGQSTNSDVCSFSLLHELVQFSERSPMKLLIERHYSRILDHSAIVSLMDEIWGCNVSSRNHTFKLTLCIFAPFLVPFLVRFRLNYTQSLLDEGYLMSKVESCLNLPIDFEQSKNFDEKTLLQIVSTSTAASPGASPSPPSVCGFFGRFCSFLRLMPLFILAFYYSPRITYILNCLCTVNFLIIFSIFVVKETEPVNFCNSYFQMGLSIYVGTLFLEEMRILLMHKAHGFWRRVAWYFEVSTLNRPMGFILLYIVGMAMINVPPASNILVVDLFEFGKITLVGSLILAYAQSLTIFATNETIGTTFIMIKKIMRRFGAIFLILLVVVIAYTVASVTLLNQVFDQNSVVYNVFDLLRYGILSIFDMTDMDDALKTCAATQFRYARGNASHPFSNATASPDAALTKQCTKRSSAALTALLTGKEVTVKLLLVQLVIPIFIKELDKYENLHERWRKKMYELVDDYLTKPPLVPPLIVICHVALVVDWMLSLCCSCLRRSAPYKFGFFMLFGRNVEFKMSFANSDYVSVTHPFLTYPVDGDNEDDNRGEDEDTARQGRECCDRLAPAGLKTFDTNMSKKYLQFLRGLLSQSNAQVKTECDEELILDLQKEIKNLREEVRNLQKEVSVASVNKSTQM